LDQKTSREPFQPQTFYETKTTLYYSYLGDLLYLSSGEHSWSLKNVKLGQWWYILVTSVMQKYPSPEKYLKFSKDKCKFGDKFWVEEFIVYLAKNEKLCRLLTN